MSDIEMPEPEYVGTVTLQYDSRPEGELIEVLYLGLFPNGQTSQVTAEQAASWQAQTGYEYEDLSLPPVEEDTPEPEEPSAPTGVIGGVDPIVPESDPDAVPDGGGV